MAGGVRPLWWENDVVVMRCLFVYRYCTMGGVETGLRFRIESLPSQEIEAHVLFLRDYGGSPTFADLDGRVFFGPSEGGFVELIRRYGYDVISVIDSFDVLEWIDRSDYTGKVIVELRSTYKHTLVHLKRLGDHRLDGILVPSRFQAENIKPYLPRSLRDGIPCRVAHNFVDLEHFGHDAGARPSTSRKIVCWVGRMDPLKNWPEFLKIADRLCERQDVEFWMVGGGGSDEEARNDFRKGLAGLRVSARLRWWPIVPNPKMPALYSLVANSGGLVLLTTQCESFGFAALEAMACRCPLIAPRVGALPEVVEHERSGLLYELGNVEQAAGFAGDLLDDATRRGRLGESAAATVRERFSPERCAAGFAAAIREIAQRA
ncbi:MAG: glycosyltransferase family 4 protein [Phycisphaerae bacterium]|nr:glycosyltransferase family 4 protein [Phycisphaerae bacterium]